jgi:hypothetical protein
MVCQGPAALRYVVDQVAFLLLLSSACQHDEGNLQTFGGQRAERLAMSVARSWGSVRKESLGRTQRKSRRRAAQA